MRCAGVIAFIGRLVRWQGDDSARSLRSPSGAELTEKSRDGSKGWELVPRTGGGSVDEVGVSGDSRNGLVAGVDSAGGVVVCRLVGSSVGGLFDALTAMVWGVARVL